MSAVAGFSISAILAVLAVLAIFSDVGDPLPLCHSERRRSICDGERGTPRMFAATMQHQGILPTRQGGAGIHACVKDHLHSGLQPLK
jgi:hypothetical protein